MRFPVQSAICLLLILLLVAAAGAATVQGVVSAPRGVNLSEIVVSIEDIAAPAPLTSQVAVMDQKGLRFVPHVLPIVVGTAVDFKNSDPLSHNVYSISDAKRFNLGLYEGGMSRRVTFDRRGVVQVLCNVHLEMSAVVLVLPNPYFARVAADGRFQISGVPAGRHRLRAWQEKLVAVEHEIVVPASGEVTDNFRMQ
jgi:plastocyanin